MNFYSRLWSVVAALFAAAGLVLAALAVPGATLLSLGVVGAVVGARGGVGVHAHLYSQPAPRRYVLGWCAGVVAGLVAFVGAVAFLGATALLGVVLLAATCPPAVRLVSSRAPRATGPPQDLAPRAQGSGPVPAAPPAPQSVRDLQDLDASQLCWRWRTSFTALQRTVGPAARLSLIQTRAAVLDEMARRDPQGFRRWLNDGARAASDPARYFPDPHRKPGAPR